MHNVWEITFDANISPAKDMLPNGAESTNNLSKIAAYHSPAHILSKEAHRGLYKFILHTT